MTIFGIDLGTSTSAAIWAEAGGNYLVNARPDGNRLTPSEVCVLEDGRVVVGASAEPSKENEETEHGRRLFRAFKRTIGTPHEVHEEFAGVAWDPIGLSALVLKKLRGDAEHSNRRLDRAVITHPQHFYTAQKNATRAAAELAGIEPVLMVSEPLAAAVAAGFGEGGNPDGHYLIVDIGGGTTDIELVEARQGVLRALGGQGDARLGGYDFDQVLLEYFHHVLMREHGVDPAQGSANEIHALQRLARETKIACQANPHFKKVRIEAGGLGVQITVKEGDFARMAAEYAQAPLTRFERLMERSFEHLPISKDDIVQVLLVGGSARLLCVQRVVEQYMPGKWAVYRDPDLAVAHGAAILGYRLEQNIKGQQIGDGDAAPSAPYGGLAEVSNVANVTPRNIGVLVTRSGAWVPSAIIAQGRVLPGQETRRYQTAEADARALEIHVVEWDTATPDLYAEVGRLVVSELPAGMPAGTPVDVTLKLDLGGGVTVEARSQGKTAAASLQAFKVAPPPVAGATAVRSCRDVISTLTVLVDVQ